MKYILDFDGVLFNTKLLKEKMDALGIPQSERSIGVFNYILQEDPDFNLENLVFDDALSFIRQNGRNCIIVSSASSIKDENNTNFEKQIKFQKTKIELSGVTEFVKDVRVVESGKQEELISIRSQFGDGIIFVDDREKYLKEAREVGIESFWMDRGSKIIQTNHEGIPVNYEFTRVGNFNELSEILEKLN